jgi:GntR family transcriptional regulator, transcriptional repressor for pyruvate dehydrogenase complex
VSREKYYKKEPQMTTQTIIKRQAPLAQQVAAFLTKIINERGIEPGGVLPTEAELSSRLGVSRSVVREAIARLKHEGIIETQKGGRSKIAKDPSGLVFRLNIGDQDETALEKLYELRAIIEPEAAAIAAVRATPEHIQVIKKRLHEIRLALSEGKDGTDESLNFHRAIIDASGNPHLAQFVAWVDKKLWSFTQEKNLYKNGELLNGVHNEHEKIVKAIEERNPKRARKIARKHVIESAKRHDLHIDIP